jgi:folate-binding protein YgfZ
MTPPLSAWQRLNELPQPPSNKNGHEQSINFALIESCGVIRFSGVDARDFLQNQLTNDVTLVDNQQAQLTGYCNAKGRLLGLFLLFTVDDGYLAICHRALIAGLLKRLRMFVMRSKVTIEDLSDEWAITGLWGSDSAEFLTKMGFALASDTAGTATQASSITTLPAQFGQPAFRLVGPREALAELLCHQPEARTEEHQWDLLMISAGEPQLTANTTESFIPQMINLDLINGVSFQKGCYPGQEIVARTRYLGKLKKRMFQFVAPCSGIEPGDPIHAQGDEQSVGTVVSVAALDHQQSQLLAVVRISALESPLSVRDTGPLTQLPLPYPVLETSEET